MSVKPENATVPSPAKKRGRKPGMPKTPGSGGSRKGVPNRATREFKETITRLLEDNADNIAVWLAQVAATDPDKALQRIGHLAEFAAPKLTRAEVTGDGGGPLQVVVNRLA